MAVKTKNKLFVTIFLAAFLWLAPVISWAQLMNATGGVENITEPTLEVGEKAGFREANAEGLDDLVPAIGFIIKTVLSFIGVVFFILVIYAGWLWLAAGGNEERITKAKDLLKNSFIGLAIIMLSYIIVSWVIYWLVGATVYSGSGVFWGE